MPMDFEDLRRWFDDAKEASADWREEAEEDYEFVAGRQFAEDDLRILREQQRPAVQFNRIGAIVDAVGGAETTNRQEVHYLPVELGDVEVNELFTNAAEWVRDQSHAEDEESDAFRDMSICGMGWCLSRLEFEDDPRGMVIVERVDPMEMYWDPSAKKRNLQDARYVMRARNVDLDDARAMFPDEEDEDLHAGWAQLEQPDTVRVEYPRYGPAADANSSPDAETRGRKQVTLVEAEYWEREPVWIVKTQGQSLMPQQIEVEQKQYDVLTRRLEMIGEPFDAVRRTRKVYYRAMLGSVLLGNHRLDPQKGGFRYQCMTGKRDRNTNTWYGLVRDGKDPQRWANKWLSQVLHIINSNAKGGLLAERDAFQNIRKAEEQWADPTSIVTVESGGLEKVKERGMARYPEGIAQLMEYAIVSIRECMGVNPELLGQVAREQAGVLEYQRRQAGMTILSTMFDSLRLYRKRQGKLMLELILRYLTDGRLIRIAGEQGEKYVPLARQEGVTEFDVKVDEASSSPNQKERVWAMLERLMPTMARFEVPGEVWAEIVRYSPLPASMAEKLAQALREPKEPDPKAMAEVEKLRAEVEERKAGALLDLAKVKETGHKVELDALSAARETAASLRTPAEHRRFTEVA